MELQIQWEREDPCGSGPTCPRVGRDRARRRVVVQGKPITDPAVRAAHGVPDDEVLVEIPDDLLPEV